MSITAVMPSGVITATAYGLHQWDYGRELRILADDLPAMVEVHFACPGMAEAIVRVANVSQEVATVSIPDKCLEQTAPIQAWVVAKGETSGYTVKEITLPILARAKPAALVDPAGEAQAVTKYDELFALTESLRAEHESVLGEASVAKEAASAAASSAAAAETAARASLSLLGTVQKYTISDTELSVTVPAAKVMVRVRLLGVTDNNVDLGVVHLDGCKSISTPLGHDYFFNSLDRPYYVRFIKESDTSYKVVVNTVSEGKASVYTGSGNIIKLELQVLGYKEATQ